MNRPAHPDAREDALAQLLSLSRFEGEPAQFWARYLGSLNALCGSRRASVWVCQEEKWLELAAAPKSSRDAEIPTAESLALWRDHLHENQPAGFFSDGATKGEANFAAALIRPEGGGEPALMILELEKSGEAQTLERLSLALAIPAQFEQRRQLDATRRDASRLASVLDLAAMLHEHAKFTSAAMALCHELASRFNCERVSLGWMEKNYIVLKAMSHTEKIEPRMEAAQQLCSLMEEACDQEEEIVWPRPEGQAFITRDHETYAKSQGPSHVATLPIFHDTARTRKEHEPPRPCGAVTLERKTAFSIDELRVLRLMFDQVARPLAEMHRRDRWFGSRWAEETREACSRLVGPEHTWWKLLAILLAVGLLVLIFGHKDYRIEGSFALKTDAMAHFSAPFEGHIERVAVKPGDLVKAGAMLVALDARELLLQKEAAVAERERHDADALKAESTGDVAGMRIAQAREAQAQAQMDIVTDRLQRAEMKAPFDGVVVEGDLREKISAPVQKGEVLLKIARIEDLYLMVEVPERDIQDLREGAAGQAAFASLPGEKFSIKVERIEPVARSKEKGNLFSVRCVFTGQPADWWRPGMSGIAKIEAGRRSLLWLATHRTVDFLRMWWW
jgi:RND family efflux transporter MFP subunit